MSEFSTVVICGAEEPIRLGDELLGGVISGAAVGDLMAELERKNQRIEHLESAWQADVIERKDRLIADQERENDRLKAELEQYKRDAERMREALTGLLKFSRGETCTHANTHRGGVIWEICDDCGLKWADDCGGKPEWKDPAAWTMAELALSAQPYHSAELEMVKPEPVVSVPLDFLNQIIAEWEHCTDNDKLAADLRKLIGTDKQAEVKP